MAAVSLGVVIVTLPIDVRVLIRDGYWRDGVLYPCSNPQMIQIGEPNQVGYQIFEAAGRTYKRLIDFTGTNPNEERFKQILDYLQTEELKALIPPEFRGLTTKEGSIYLTAGKQIECRPTMVWQSSPNETDVLRETPVFQVIVWSYSLHPPEAGGDVGDTVMHTGTDPLDIAMACIRQAQVIALETVGDRIRVAEEAKFWANVKLGPNDDGPDGGASYHDNTGIC